MRNDNTQIQKPPTDLPGLFIVGAFVAGGITIFGWIAWTKFTYGWPVSLSMPILLETARSFHWPLSPIPARTDLALGNARSLDEIPSGLVSSLRFAFEILETLSLTAGGFLVFRMAKGQSQLIRHKRGDQLREEAGTIQKQIRKRFGPADGISVYPGIRIPESLEVRSFSLVGAPGAGKTTVLNGMVDQAIARRDKCLIFDFKGDFMERIPDKGKIVLSPWDDRAVRWNLGADVSTEVQARLLSECLIPINPRDSQPMWGNASRAILRAELHKLMAERRGTWGFCELGDALLADILSPESDEVVQNLVRKYNPEAARIVQDLTSKTTLSVLIDQSAALGDTLLLSRFDRELLRAGRPSLSVLDYLSGTGNSLPVILPVHPDSRTLTAAFVSSLFSVASSVVTNFPDAKPSDRRIWIFLDEVPQAGKIPTITDFLVTARSKGCRTVLGFQTPSQIAEGYGEKTLEIWDNATSVKVFLQCVGPEAKKYVSQSVGEREILVMKKSDNIGIAPTHTGHTKSWVDDREKLVSPDEVASLLGPGKNGVTGILQIAGCEPAVLTWPFRNDPVAAMARRMLTLPPRGTGSGSQKTENTGEEREKVPGTEEEKIDPVRKTKEPGAKPEREPGVQATPLSKSPEAAGEKDGEEGSPVGEIAEEAFAETLHLDPSVTVLKMLAELSTPAPPAAGVRIEARAANKKEQEEEDEESR